MDEYLRALESVPETRLRLLELMRELSGKDGRVDYRAAAKRAADVNLAVAEAAAYIQATRSAVEALLPLPGRAFPL